MLKMSFKSIHLILSDLITGQGIELLSCDLLREGAPIEPVPPVTHWKPDAVVRETTPTLD